MADEKNPSAPLSSSAMMMMKKTPSPTPVVSSAASAVGWPTCQSCGGPFLRYQDGPVFIAEKRPLIGDTIFKYTCSRCTVNHRPLFERLPLNWTTALQLVLYHLHRNAQNKGIKVGYFRLKEDICQCIEDHWEWLFPSHQKTPTWSTNVINTLSTHTDLFISGIEALKQPGWWALKFIRPVSRYSTGYTSPPSTPINSRSTTPRPSGLGETTATKLIAKAEPDKSSNIILSSSATAINSTLTKRKRPAKVSPPSASGESTSLAAAASTSAATNPLCASVASTVPPRLAMRSPMTLDTAQTLLLAKHFAERIPPVSALLPAEQEATPTSMRAAQEIKRKLVERLLKVDSKLLKEALANAPVPPATLISSGSLGNGSSNTATNSSNNEANSNNDSSCSTTSTPPPSQMNLTGSISLPVTPLPRVTPINEGRQLPRPVSTGPSADLKRLRAVTTSRPANYVRASPHENELLELCFRVINPDARVVRLKRKLLGRRIKRRNGVSLFDLDQFMYQYLKSNDPFILHNGQVVAVPMAVAMKKTSDTVSSVGAPATFYDIPFYRNPALSFLAKLYGVSELYEYPWPFYSTFTGNLLPPFIHREHIIKPRKMKLLEDIRNFGGARKKEATANIVDSRPEDIEDSKDTIDFINVRKEWLGQVNSLLSRTFWPGIDMIDTLDYPDYGVLVMYRKLVIGCAFLTPDAYLTYFAIHPEWSNEGLGNLLLYLLITRVAPPGRDITLHVSVDNPALLLYQRFTFKPEEFVINFYDKYYRDDELTFGAISQFSKHAFLMRYRNQVF